MRKWYKVLKGGEKIVHGKPMAIENNLLLAKYIGIHTTEKINF